MRNGEAIASTLGGRRERPGWAFRCPCHGTGRKYSAIVFDNGYLFCHAGCDAGDIAAKLDELGLTDDGIVINPDPDEIARSEAARIAKARDMWDEALDQ